MEEKKVVGKQKGCVGWEFEKNGTINAEICMKLKKYVITTGKKIDWNQNM